MAFPIGSGLLEAMVLAVVAREDTYGYKITQDIQTAAGISESTLYPVLRRLQKDECLTVYDKGYMGRNRRYYRLTEKGSRTLAQFRNDWVAHKQTVDRILCGGVDE